jgi:hypothetical protein
MTVLFALVLFFGAISTRFELLSSPWWVSPPPSFSSAS